MTTDADAESGEVVPHDGRNDLLRLARLRTPSPSGSTKPMSQRELAEAITAHVQRATGRDVALDRHDISRWENGKRHCQTVAYRDALRIVLGVATDAELGFHIAARPHPTTATSIASTAAKLAIKRIGTDGPAVRLVPSAGAEDRSSQEVGH